MTCHGDDFENNIAIWDWTASAVHLARPSKGYHCRSGTKVKGFVALAGSDALSRNSPNRIFLMSSFNDIELDRNGNEERCSNAAREAMIFSKDCNPGCWCFIRIGSHRSWNCDSKHQTRGR